MLPTRRDYYVYSYVRSCESVNGCAGSPYYIGKGRGRRVVEKHSVSVPKDSSKIIYIAKSMNEPDAHQLEVLMIYLHGRIDIGTGCLRNLTNGGEGPSGAIVSEATRKLKREQLLGRKRPESVVAKWRGKKRSPETIEKLRNKVMPPDWLENVKRGKLTGKSNAMTPEGKERLIASLKSRVVSQETREKLRKNALGNTYGRFSWKSKNKSGGQKFLFDFPDK